MGPGGISGVLRSHRLGVSLVVGLSVLAAVLSHYRVTGGVPPKLVPRVMETAVASKQIVLDTEQSSVLNWHKDAEPLLLRARTVSQILSSPALLKLIAREARIPEDQLTSEGPWDGPAAIFDNVTPAEARGNQIVAERRPYRLAFVPRTNLPLITVSAQGPSPAAAARLADATVPALQRFLLRLAADTRFASDHPLVVRDLGDATAGSVGGGAKAAPILAALATFILGFLALVGVSAARGLADGARPARRVRGARRRGPPRDSVLRPVRRGLLAALALAVLAGGLAGYDLEPGSLRIEPRDRGYGVAESEMLVDTARPSLLDTSQITITAGQSALTYALLLQTDGPRAEIAHAAGLPPSALRASGPFTTLLDRPNIVRKRDLPVPSRREATASLVLDVADGQPMLSFYAQAPTAQQAVRIIDAAKLVLQRHVARQQATAPPPTEARVALRSLGPTTSGTVAAHASWEIATIVFLLTFALGSGVVVLRHRRRHPHRVAPGPEGRPGTASADDDDCWPRTRRPVPWVLAAFLAMIFLLPFDAISLPIPIPLDGKLDRVMLLVLIAVWVAALLSPDERARPRAVLTRVHVTGLLFLAVVCIGAVVNASDLVNIQEFKLVLKKVALLMSFLTFFAIVASSIRPREVPRFVRLMLGMATIAGLGAILEYRLRFNPFYGWTAHVLPVAFPGDLYSRDSIGRLTVYGPTGHPLELATLLAAMAPFALLGLSDATDRRRRILYGLALGLLLAGALSTVRKTSVLAPIPGIAVLLAYRPRILTRRMLPLVALMGVLVHFAAPGTLGSMVSQLSPSQFGSVRSTQDRTADYGGVAPDVKSHLLFGRGYQSYDPHKYRILDNEYLFLVIGVGLVGLVLYVAILASAMTSAHATIRGPDPVRARHALGATAAVAVVALATLFFDVLSFPHVPYLMFFMAGMLVVLRRPHASSPRSVPVAPPEPAEPVAPLPLVGARL